MIMLRFVDSYWHYQFKCALLVWINFLSKYSTMTISYSIKFRSRSSLAHNSVHDWSNVIDSIHSWKFYVTLIKNAHFTFIHIECVCFVRWIWNICSVEDSEFDWIHHHVLLSTPTMKNPFEFLSNCFVFFGTTVRLKTDFSH